LKDGLPAKTAVVEYSSLPTKHVIWVVKRRRRLESETVEVSSQSLEDAVLGLRSALLHGRRADVERIAAQLYDLLVRPVIRHLDPGERLVFVPDGPLHSLPFAVLRDKGSQRFLVQDHACVVAPSARVFSAGRRLALSLSLRSSPRVLVIAAPNFDRELNPSLSRLTASGTEASLDKDFPGSLILTGRSATRNAFLRAAGEFEIVHFGGHSEVNLRSPLLSRMLFASEPGDSSRGVLSSSDVLGLHFPRTFLVVLASCSTAHGKISRTEGVESLVRPFLAAGVPAVVASLWTVDDALAADFFARFYRFLKGGQDVAGALQATQVEMIEHSSGIRALPAVWGTFEAIGGGALGAKQPINARP
jgi:CHAT domain-containing protein